MAKDKKPKKVLTEEEKAARRAKHAEGERKRQRKLKDLGFTRSQSRSIKKALSDQETLSQLPVEVIAEVAKTVTGFADWLEQVAGNLMADNPEILPRPKPKKKSRAKKSKKQIKADAQARKVQRDIERRTLFDIFLENSNIEGKSIYQLVREYRAGGGSISEANAKRYLADYQNKDSGDIRHISYADWSRDPHFKKLFKNRYMYLVRYQVQYEEVDEEADDEEAVIVQSMDRHMWVGRNDPFTSKEELFEYVLQKYDEYQNMNDEKYINALIDPDSLELIRAVDLGANWESRGSKTQGKKAS